MARIRTIKPELFHSETLAGVSLAAERTFIGLLTQADDYGGLRYNAAVLNGALWPLRADHTSDDLQAEVDELIECGAICQFNVEGKTYLHFPTWGDHQKIARPSTRKQAPPCPVHQAPPAVAVTPAPKVVSHPAVDTEAVPAPVEPDPPVTVHVDTSAAPPPAEHADDISEQEDSDMGIYDNPVDAFAELHPTPKKRTTRKKAPAKTQSKDPASPTPAQVVNKLAQDYYDSINGLADFQKVRSVVSKAVKAGYEPDRIAEAMKAIHKAGRPLTAEVLSQFLEGYARPGGRPGKEIHYAADKPREQRAYREEW